MSRLTRLVRDENYPYAAESSTDICPDLVDVADYGHHRSMVGAYKKRYWGFVTEAGRDKFVQDVEAGKLRRVKN